MLIKGDTMTTAVEVRVVLSGETAERLHQVAQTQGVPEGIVIEQALDLLFELGDTSLSSDYWLSTNSMHDDWDAMPDDWMADEVKDAIPPR